MLFIKWVPGGGGGQMDDMTVVQEKRKNISIRKHSNESEKGNMLYLNTADHA